MSIDSENLLWDALKRHVGHEVRIVFYGDSDDPADVCLECEDCSEVVLDAELYTLQARGEPTAHWIPCAGKSNLWYCSNCGEKISYNPNRRTYTIEKKPVYKVHRFCRGCGLAMQPNDEFNPVQPIKVKEDGTIVSGHARAEMAKRLGMTEVACEMEDGE